MLYLILATILQASFIFLKRSITWIQNNISKCIVSHLSSSFFLLDLVRFPLDLNKTNTNIWSTTQLYKIQGRAILKSDTI